MAKTLEGQAKEVRKLAAQIHKNEEADSMDLAINKAHNELGYEPAALFEAFRLHRAENTEFERAFSMT